MTRRDASSMLIGASAAVLSGCNLFDTDASYRFRMTVEVATPQGIKRGSSVYEVKAVKNGTKLLADERAGGTATFGQATIVDLPDSHPLFVLMKVPRAGEGLHDVVTRALAPGMPEGGIDNFIAAVRAVSNLPYGTSADLPRSDWPKVVRFYDLSVPESVQSVDASTEIARIQVNTTNEKITSGLEQRLSWLGDRGQLLDRSSKPTSHPSLAQTLYHGDFWIKAQ